MKHHFYDMNYNFNANAVSNLSFYDKMKWESQ